MKFPMCSASLSFLSLSLKNKQKKNQLIQIKKPGGLRRKHGPPPLLAGSSLDKKGFVENRQKDDWTRSGDAGLYVTKNLSFLGLCKAGESR